MDTNLKVISWNVTRRCNLDCKHCYLPADFKSDGIAGPAGAEELSTEEARTLINQISSESPEVMLILSGGEPLLREDIYEIAEYASGKGMMVVVGTNGLLLNDEIADRLKKSGVSGLS
ncbi:radical SAM protein, partial [bacterium]|nr:radical SAM protein [bacterium]